MATRAQVFATEFGYTLLIDDTNWNLGPWRNYFDPTELECEPPIDWAWTEPAVRLGKPGWETQSRIWLSSSDVKEMDDFIRSHLLDSSTLSALPAQLSSPPDETVPEELLPIFSTFSLALEALWKPNDAVQMMVINERRVLHLGSDEDNGRESGRAPIVAVQFSEQFARERAQRKKGKTNKKDILSNYVKAANAALEQLHTKAWTHTADEETPVLLITPTDNALLDNAALEAFTSSFVLETTTAPGPQSLFEWAEQLGDLGLDLPQLQAAGTKAVLVEYSEKEFRKLPHPVRVHLTKLQVRDLEIGAKFADGFVVSGLSSVGRVGCLLGGTAADNVRSADGVWYPTSTLDALLEG